MVMSVFAGILSGCVGEGGGEIAVVENFAIAYVKRSLTAATDNADVRDVLAFRPGADLYLRDLAAPGASERNLTAVHTGGAGDVKDVVVSYDGEKLLFALRMPEIEDADPEDQPTWNIWEFDLSTNDLRRVIASDIVAEAG